MKKQIIITVKNKADIKMFGIDASSINIKFYREKFDGGICMIYFDFVDLKYNKVKIKNIEKQISIASRTKSYCNGISYSLPQIGPKYIKFWGELKVNIQINNY